MSPVISVENLSKAFPSTTLRTSLRLRFAKHPRGAGQAASARLAQALSRATWKSGGLNCAAPGDQPHAPHPIRSLGRTVGETDHGNRDGEELWALQDVSFAVAGSKVVVK